MSYRHTGRPQTHHRPSKPEECIYCPLQKPIAWPFIFLLFAFGPLIFLSGTSTSSSKTSIEPPPPLSQPPPLETKEEVTSQRQGTPKLP